MTYLEREAARARAEASLITIGSRVAFRASFLRSIGDYSHAAASRRGTVVGLQGLGINTLVLVGWDEAEYPSGALACNLILADRIALEPA